MSELSLEQAPPPRVPRKRATPMGSRRIEILIDRFRSYCDSSDNPSFIEDYIFAIEQMANHDNPAYFEFIKTLKQIPVGIETFLDSDEFMGATDLVLWPEVRKAIIEVNRDWFKGISHGAKTQFLGSGATGTGKSEVAKVTAAYGMHIIGCMDKPQAYWKIPTATQMILPIFAAKPKVTKNVLYEPLRAYIATMPWFIKHMMFDKFVESEMVFKGNNLRVTPVGADIDSILGEAVFSAIIDEINFMQIVQNSRRAEVKGGRSSTYNQAEDIYRKTTRRKAGRFTRPGPNVGVISTMSSTLYPGEFTEKLEKQIHDQNLHHIYVYNKAQYEVRPSDNYSGEIFHVCVHEDAAGTIQLKDKGEELPKFAKIYDVPIELRNDFIEDAEGATRDVIGKSVRPLSPFFTRISAVQDAFDLGTMVDMPQIVEQMNVQLSFDGMPEMMPGHYCKNPSRPRYVHIDLAHTGDRCGIGMVRFDGMADMERKAGESERLPTCTVELAISIEPGNDEEGGIELSEVRAWVMRLKKDYGYPIRVVSFDSWNSLESRQQMKKRGMPTTLLSVDKTSAPYKQFRDALYDGRIALPNSQLLHDEMRELEFDDKKDKVDHPPTGSKDCVDGVCGAYYLMLQRSETWLSGDDGGRIDTESDRYGTERVDLGDRR